jgi:hypothetical protein
MIVQDKRFWRKQNRHPSQWLREDRFFAAFAGIGGYEDVCVVEVIAGWCYTNEKNNRHRYFDDGQWWTRFTAAQFEELTLGAISERRAKRMLPELVAEEILFFTELSWGGIRDRTGSYRPNYEKIELLVCQKLGIEIDDDSAQKSSDCDFYDNTILVPSSMDSDGTKMVLSESTILVPSSISL